MTGRESGLIGWARTERLAGSSNARDVHRYRIAPQLAAVIEAQCANGRLAIRAAHMHYAAFTEGEFRIVLRCRDAGLAEARFEAVAICAGPNYGDVIASNPVLAGPLARAHFGELMGLPEVSWPAAFVAREIDTALSRLRSISADPCNHTV